MTDEELEELKKLCDDATPGPWKWKMEWKENGHYSGSMGELDPGVLWYGMDGEEGIYSPKQADAEFIASAREAIPSLIKALDWEDLKHREAYMLYQVARKQKDQFQDLLKDIDAYLKEAEGNHLFIDRIDSALNPK